MAIHRRCSSLFGFPSRFGHQAGQTHRTGYLALARFNELRRAAKLIEGDDTAPAGPDRFLAAPAIDASALQRPYAD